MAPPPRHGCPSPRLMRRRGEEEKEFGRETSSECLVLRAGERGIASAWRGFDAGKSTLLNNLFGTNFKVMDAAGPSSQTTHGIWLAKAADIDPCTLIIDVEGSDSSERAEYVTFEKQSALFALAMSDITLINLWHHDIGREQAGCRALLKTVFQVMMRLRTPRRRTLLFVIRDKNPVTPLACLTEQLQESIHKIYDAVYKPEGNKEAKLSDFFDVRCSLSMFTEVHTILSPLSLSLFTKVDSLRQCIVHSTTSGGFAGYQQDKPPASGISDTAQTIWKEIVENKDLDLPMLQIMVANERCEQILNEKFRDFTESEEWRDLRSGHVKKFGKRMTLAISSSLSKYDKEALFYDEGVQSEKRQILQDKLLQLVQPAYQIMLDHLHDEVLNSFQKNLDARGNGEPLATAARRCSNYSMSEFDEGCKDVAIEQATWDSSSVRDKLEAAINAHITLAEAQEATSAAQADAAGARRDANIARAIAFAAVAYRGVARSMRRT